MNITRQMALWLHGYVDSAPEWVQGVAVFAGIILGLLLVVVPGVLVIVAIHHLTARKRHAADRVVRPQRRH